MQGRTNTEETAGKLSWQGSNNSEEPASASGKLVLPGGVSREGEEKDGGREDQVSEV